MEILDPKNAQLAPETLNLFDQVTDTIAELNKARPFSAEVKHRINRDFLPDRVTATLNMEGISVSRRQTLLMMDAMRLDENASKAEREILNALKADEFVFRLASEKSALNSATIREIHQILQESVLDSAGAFRTGEIEITGASFLPPSGFDVPRLISDLVSVYADLDYQHPVLKAAWLHATFTHIHPFEDGNGRTGRLLQDYALLSSGLFPTGVPSSRRDDYYDALEKADNGDWNPLCQMLSEFQLNSISKIQAILDEVVNRSAFVAALAKRAKDKKQGALHKKYIVWRHRMTNFVDQMIATCDEFNNLNDAITIQNEPFAVIEFSKWSEIKKSGWAPNSWLLKQNWISEGELLFRNIFFFRRHNFRPEDIHPRTDLYGTVGLHITGGVPEFGARFDFESFSDPDIKLREIIFVNDTLHCYKASQANCSDDPSREEEWICSEESDFSTLINSFLEDVLVRKLGI